MKYHLTYDDIQLVPQFSNIKSRTQINLNTLVSRRYGLINPIVASPMDTVCGEDMAMKMFTLGGVGCIHRFMTIEEQCNIIFAYHIDNDPWFNGSVTVTYPFDPTGSISNGGAVLVTETNAA